MILRNRIYPAESLQNAGFLSDVRSYDITTMGHLYSFQSLYFLIDILPLTLSSLNSCLYILLLKNVYVRVCIASHPPQRRNEGVFLSVYYVVEKDEKLHNL